ncbi:hypothetical protein H5410_036496 [Solanum commersonii]|uniref:Uncharacterized protein n=1 Tax=Solanum commersonii TaxID=4109 RepID=A0A9J5Y6Q0_SOLCO|nr:hypothetical protein H5410_036496 [Solanum commersonii]
MARVILVGWEDEDIPGSCEEEEEGGGVLEGSEARVGEGASAGNELTLNSGEVSAGVAFLLSTSSHMNSASICWMSVEDEGMTSISFAGSQGTPMRRHNSVIKTENDK